MPSIHGNSIFRTSRYRNSKALKAWLCVEVDTRPSFFRTASGNEIDLLLELPGGQLCAIEIKHSAAPKLGKGFVEVLDALELKSGFVIAPVGEPFPLSQRAMALPLSHVAKIFGQNQPVALVIKA